MQMSIGQHTDSADLKSTDLLLAVCLHALVLTVLLMLHLWHGSYEFHPQSVQVSLISPQQLNRMLRHEEHHARPQKHVAPARHERVKEPKHTPAKAPEKAHLSIAKPAKKTRKVKHEEPFNPFKPLESSTDVKSSTASTTHSQQQTSDVFAGQLSKQEINRYIARIQQAVQNHWRVPVVSGNVHDPLVEMVLNPDGSVDSVKILESSGNDALDASLIRAIRTAAPFEVPSHDFALFRDNRIRFHPLR